MFIVGLTGGIGVGKSLVASLFAELGVKVINADKISRILVEKGKPALQAIVEHFGEDILLPNQELDRTKLRQIIFNDEKEKIWLEKLLHPAIREFMQTESQNYCNKNPKNYVIWEVALLLETKMHNFCDKVLLVTADKQIQLKRATLRDGNAETIAKIIASQDKNKNTNQFVTEIIENNIELDEGLTILQNKVAKLHQKYQELAQIKESKCVQFL